MATFSYNVVFALPGIIDNTATVPGTVLPVETFPFEVDFSANFGGSVGSVGTNPAAQKVFTIFKNGGQVGTITCNTDGTVLFASTGGAPVIFVTQDRMTIQAPIAADATLADVAFTLNGTVTQ